MSACTIVNKRLDVKYGIIVAINKRYSTHGIRAQIDRTVYHPIGVFMGRQDKLNEGPDNIGVEGYEKAKSF